MIVKIENPSESYVGNGIVNVTTTVTIYADDGITVLHQKGLSTRANTKDTNLDPVSGELLWKVNAVNDLKSKAQEVVDVFDATMKAVATAWPTATTPQEALDLLASEVEAGIVIPV